jgi:hypothetical protein
MEMILFQFATNIKGMKTLGRRKKDDHLGDVKDICIICNANISYSVT